MGYENQRWGLEDVGTYASGVILTDPADDAISNAWLQGQIVLLVEDNVIVGMAASATLTMLGAADVIVAASIEQAEAYLATAIPDVAILDINLGSKTTFELARRLRTLEVPFIFASGYGDDADRPDDLRMFPIVAKPYRREQLAAAVWAMVDEASARRAGRIAS